VPICFGLLALECARRVWRPSGLVEEAQGAPGVPAAQEERA
jgi:hypothetical protein